MEVVFAKDTLNVTFNGQRHHIPRGQAWDKADPLVARFPDAFSADERYVHRTVAEESAGEAPVERATRAPGERRETRRPRGGQ